MRAFQQSDQKEAAIRYQKQNVHHRSFKLKAAEIDSVLAASLFGTLSQLKCFSDISLLLKDMWQCHLPHVLRG